MKGDEGEITVQSVWDFRTPDEVYIEGIFLI